MSITTTHSFTFLSLKQHFPKLNATITSVGSSKRRTNFVKTIAFSANSLDGIEKSSKDLKSFKTDKNMSLKIFCDRMSQPSRAIIIFCKVNKIDFEEVTIDIFKNQQQSPEYKAINPMAQVPAILDGDFSLFESHAILIYLSCKFPGVASHWYPSDLIERAKVHSVLDWHHGNLRRGSVGVLVSTIFEPLKGIPSSPQAIEEAEKALAKSLSVIEEYWLKDGPFLVGRSQPSIADLNLVCEVMELELLDKKQHERILSPFKKVVKWVEDTRSATAPYFDEVHEKLFKSKIGFQEILQHYLETNVKV
ncbi:S-crystallin, Glutathione S-transferase (GST) [Artemisia annua]|uniref:glutathione transferase n=1 Tax=Artemisia annua TaxID=35608 RepID=A0A2U1KBH4_ARTAN|nr:S-crystallin, Glutathione S-transferase (GST) [Artemisia annua]